MKWTAKLPALLLGIILFIAGLIAIAYRKSRTATIVGLSLIVLGSGFIGYSLTIKNWCVPGPGSAFSSAFHQSFAACLRQKTWLEF